MSGFITVVKLWIIISFVLLCVPFASAIPAWGQENEFVQPDGKCVTVRVWGDEFYRRLESVDGYTLVRETPTNRLCYAYLSNDQTEFVSTGHIYQGGAMPETVRQKIMQQAKGKGFRKSLKIKPQTRKQIIRKRRKALWDALPASRQTFDEMVATPHEETAIQPAANQQIVGLTMLIDFPDAVGTISQTTVQNFCNQIGYAGNGNNGSVRDYFYDVSGGKLAYTNVVTPYIRASHNKSYYDNYSYGDMEGAKILIEECFEKLVDSGFDLSGVTRSGSTIVALNVLYAGSWGNYDLWPHQWSVYYSHGGYTIGDYEMTGMKSYLKLGAFCHENGHLICGWPDLYDTDYSSLGLGDFCLMASGSYAGSELNPAMPCAYLRMDQGWENVIDITNDAPETLRTHQANSLMSYRYSNSSNSDEYFLIESRIRSGRNADYPDEGLVIWHVDEAKLDLYSNGSNNEEQRTSSLHYCVSVEQADGAFHLEKYTNYGGSGDLFHAGYQAEFSDAATPDAKWWNGSDSGLVIRDISAVGATMSFVCGSVPTPPVSTNVNENAEIDTSITITLEATDDGVPEPLSYTITSLPNHGTLTDPSASAIDSVPYTLAAGGDQVVYTPRPGCDAPAAFTYLANDGGVAPEGGDSNQAVVTVGIQSSILFEDFENGLGSFNIDNTVGDGSGLWHRATGCNSALSGHSAPTSLYYGLDEYCDYYSFMQKTEGAVVSDVITLPDVSSITLQFSYMLKTEGYAGYDVASVEVSQNGGSFVSMLSNSDGTLEDPSDGWVVESIDLSSMAGSDIRVRFRFETVDAQNNDYPGFYVDDVQIQGPNSSQLVGDFEPDCDVDLDDLTLLMTYWLTTCGDCDGTDLVDDNIVNLADFKVLADNWLAGL